jgi:O-antigen ligase
MHEAFLPLNYSAHNAYLAMLADTGVFGFLWYVTLMAGAMIGMFRLADAPTRRLAIAVVASYAVVGLFERRAINGANPMSLFFLMTALFVLREGAFARVRRAAWGAGTRPAIIGAGG